MAESLADYDSMIVATIHTHSACSVTRNDCYDRFSKEDLDYLGLTGLFVYVAAPNGVVLRYNPHTGEIDPFIDIY